MKVHFSFHRKIDGKLFARGPHEVPDSFKSHWYFKHLLAGKDVQILGDDVKAKAEAEAKAKAEAEAKAKAEAEAEEAPEPKGKKAK